MDVVGAVASLISTILDCGKLICRPIYLHSKNFFKLQSNLISLQEKKTSLNDLKNTMVAQVDAAVKSGCIPRHEVKEWIRDVEKVMSVADSIILQANNPRGCFLKCSFSRKVSKTLEKMIRLLCTDHSQIVMDINVRPQQRTRRTVEHIPAPYIEDQATASQNLSKIMEMLKRDEVRRVGIWGMGGVGKTTLVKNLNNKLMSSSSSQQPFGLVIWATISKDMSLRRVQMQIAARLELLVGENDEERMAIQLHERLMEEGTFLLILDDVWERIDLDKLGIPRPEVHKGYKILLTSRSRAVCTQMDMDEEFKVAVLNDEEAWNLFRASVGEVANSEQIVPFAKAVLREFCGLPLAIIIMGAAMRKQGNVVLWKDALSEMRRSVPSAIGIEKEVFNPLKWSYDSLQGNNIKSCFLYCCLYPEDFCIKISELVECWVGEGLIDEELNYEDSVNRGIALVEHLKDVCLLEHGEKLYDDGKKSVKMHDIVRDVAIWIASSEKGSSFLVRSGLGLTEISEVVFPESLKRVSFMNNNIRRIREGRCRIECSKASTLLLQGNYNLEDIPAGFLQGFQALKVLNIRDTGIESLPQSIMQLGDLNALLVSGCSYLKQLPSNGWEGLKRIQFLDLSDTCIKDLPKGLGHLGSLRKLDLSRTHRLESLPAGAICVLSSLEVLEMNGSAYEWCAKEVVEDGKASIEELQCPNKLHTLTARIGSKSILSLESSYLSWISGLARFQFLISDSRDELSFNEDRLVKVNDVSLSEARVGCLLTHATSLMFSKCKGLDRMLENMAINSSPSFSSLKKLVITSSEISFVRGQEAKSASRSQFDLVPNLEELVLGNLKREDLPQDSISGLVSALGLGFSKLRLLTVYNCAAMKYLFSVGDGGLVQLLGNLEVIDISDCSVLVELFQYVSSLDCSSVLPKLQKIAVKECPKLKIPVSIHNKMHIEIS